MKNADSGTDITKKIQKRYVSKNQSLHTLIQKLKLWPSRTGLLHGLKSVEKSGKTLIVKTHCNEEFIVWDSKKSRSARWLRNRWCTSPCTKCKIPQWKIEKYSSTIFTNEISYQTNR